MNKEVRIEDLRKITQNITVGKTEINGVILKQKMKDLDGLDISSEHYKTMLKYSACDEDVDLGRPCLSLNCKCTGFKPHPWRSVLYFYFPNQQ
ncbi:unnamed protein product [Brugia timori]|uniref:Phage protein n=1 Tax=Brugia timori TaxID=42155 RepID=A0A0R3QJK0_9BILA|nr:unnamed protein product [Brugia timori]